MADPDFLSGEGGRGRRWALEMIWSGQMKTFPALWASLFPLLKKEGGVYEKWEFNKKPLSIPPPLPLVLAEHHTKSEM